MVIGSTKALSDFPLLVTQLALVWMIKWFAFSLRAGGTQSFKQSALAPENDVKVNLNYLAFCDRSQPFKSFTILKLNIIILFLSLLLLFSAFWVIMFRISSDLADRNLCFLVLIVVWGWLINAASPLFPVDGNV